jgi:hypothetical protein
MKRSSYFLSLALIALSAFAYEVVHDSFSMAVHAWRSCRDWVVKFALAPIAMSGGRDGFLARKPAVQLIAARAFFSRCVRRAQPRIESQWRLCASA